MFLEYDPDADRPAQGRIGVEADGMGNVLGNSADR